MSTLNPSSVTVAEPASPVPPKPVLAAVSTAPGSAPAAAPTQALTLVDLFKLLQATLALVALSLMIRLLLYPDYGASRFNPTAVTLGAAAVVVCLLPWTLAFRRPQVQSFVLWLLVFILAAISLRLNWAVGTVWWWMLPSLGITLAIGWAAFDLKLPARWVGKPWLGRPSAATAGFLAVLAFYIAAQAWLALQGQNPADAVTVKRGLTGMFAVLLSTAWLLRAIHQRQRWEQLQATFLISLCLLYLLGSVSNGLLEPWLAARSEYASAGPALALQLILAMGLALLIWEQRWQKQVVYGTAIVLVAAVGMYLLKRGELAAYLLPTFALTLTYLWGARSPWVLGGLWLAVWAVFVWMLPAHRTNLVLYGMHASAVLLITHYLIGRLARQAAALTQQSHALAPASAPALWRLAVSGLSWRQELLSAGLAALFVAVLGAGWLDQIADDPSDYGIQMAMLGAVISWGIVNLGLRALFRRQAQALSAQLLAQTAAMLEASISSFVLYRADGQFVFANQAALGMSGYSKAQLDEFNLFTHGLYQRLGLSAHAAEVLRTGQPSTLDTQVVLKREQRRDYRYHFSRLALEGESPLLLQVQDQTDVLRSAREREALLDSAVVGIGHVCDGHWQWVNPEFARMLGTTPDQLLGRATQAVFAEPNGRRRMVEEIRAQLAQGGSVADLSAKFRHFDGRVIDVAGKTFVMDKERMDAVFSLRDVTDELAHERAMQAALEQARAGDEAKSVFLRTMSHEIRTPLNGIMGALQVLQFEARPDQKEMIDVGLNTSYQLLSIVNDVLDLSAAASGKLSVQAEAANFAACFAEIESVSRVVPRAAGVDLQFSIGGGLQTMVMMDAVRCKQILMNLINNALKFTPQGQVQVHASSLGERDGRLGVQVQVRDTGIGMTKEVLARLFQPFVQADDRVNRNYDGTGLGLSIARSLARRMGGDIEVTSEPGKGSTFTVTLWLPLASGEYSDWTI